MFALRRAAAQPAVRSKLAAATFATAAAVPRLAARTASAVRAPAASLLHKRAYHEVPQETYGYRVSRKFQLPDYTPEELANRQANANLLRLVQAYRVHGHRAATLDPLGLNDPAQNISELDPARYGLDAAASYNLTGILHVGQTSDATLSRERASLATIVKHLRNTYANKIAYEFSHIADASERRWFAHMVESYEKKPLSADQKRRMHALLAKSEVFDLFMTKKFPQVKRYGLEGAEAMMVAVDTLFSTANAAGIVDLVLCMPHRGRLNLLTDLLQYNPTGVFAKIKGVPEYPAHEADVCTGDVLSHIAQSVDLEYAAGQRKLHVSLLHNPSHLEAINPVAMGKTRARQMESAATGAEGSDCYLGDRVMCVQMHGDAAFAGQGVVMETLGLSNLPHYTCGGSVHVIVNNQVGYTTPATNARSSTYASDVGKMINAPVIHVNGDHPEEVAAATALAVEYRNKFHKDVILDLIAFRRWGHNELDEPGFTQPKMYKVIRARESVPKGYEKKLIAEGVLDAASAESLRDAWYKKLDADLDAVPKYEAPATHLQGKWAGLVSPKAAVVSPPTGVAVDSLKEVGLASVATPAGFEVHPRLKKFHVEARAQRLQQDKPVDWATAEALAFGSLLKDGFGIRISGQDVGRGTFSQRHCMLVDQNTENVYTPLNAMNAPNQGKLEIANSSLSEFAVLGFEFGISWESPKTLPIWEAQFGDFFNGAQIIIDTFINSSEAKWLRQSGLTMLLPHGWDGTGPEHSTCRVERFLQLCADPSNVHTPEMPRNPNMHVVFPTTPAQYFHVLRRQMVRDFRKPLIVVGPKTLLRLPAAVSPLTEMGPGTKFLPVLADPAIANPATAERLVIVSGKFYYELAKERDAKGLTDKVALVRLEELCPFPVPELKAELAKFTHVKQIVYAQEEPENQGAYSYVAPRLAQMTDGKLVQYVGRVASAAPATGVGAIHRKEQAAVIAKALGL
ncbi:hypothetical protein H9P43_007315 [Blastocladiella emersonii ATCC 22665]|nr:hypothetical protein H9P43_007315 [Blastocladiella emersonii ATCC 22665]